VVIVVPDVSGRDRRVIALRFGGVRKVRTPTGAVLPNGKAS